MKSRIKTFLICSLAVITTLNCKAQETNTELKKKREENLKTRDLAVKAFQTSPDIVKIAFKNKCESKGTLFISTGDQYTSFNITLNEGEQSNFMICRPGNKVYLGNDIIYVVSPTSDNKVIDFCPPKTEPH